MSVEKTTKKSRAKQDVTSKKVTKNADVSTHTVKVLDFKTLKESGEIQLSFLNEKLNKCLLKEAVEYQQNKKRMANAKTKDRSEVSGSNLKMRPQKGTGRSRAGDKRMPHWRGGGVVFGPNGRIYEYSFPKQKFQKAIYMVLAAKYKDNDLIVVNNLDCENISTKSFISKIEEMKTNNAIFIDSDYNRNLVLSSRNVPNIDFLPSIGINPLSLLKRKTVIVTEQVMKNMEEKYV